MKKFLLLAFCTVTIIGSEIKHTFILNEDSKNNGIFIKDSTTQKAENVYIKGPIDSKQSLIYCMVNYKYSSPVSKNDALLIYFQDSTFDEKNTSYKYNDNSQVAQFKPFALLEKIDSIDNHKSYNYFIINKKAEVSYKVEIILSSNKKQALIKTILNIISSGKKQTQNQQVEKLIITQIYHSWLYPTIKWGLLIDGGFVAGLQQLTLLIINGLRNNIWRSDEVTY